ncbi:glycoside hydrolase family 2 TIM barrel-domain containing protein [Coleofasciculus sp. FACHB-1120]|uniref:glycoside hydrolase family 2 protein n=1 Tax=Coleofasciculus sp. FACHB-1120 TaxID=2692783 RepID=UPI0016891410|nr:glycoside hydrolase family 2 TIM barrel-domain containing protein [Coleofasciculus sp. FACHB-1120]MBD2744497.1 glycoside hydrolase family 2 [Coleofasciculus sp. FACHB-1120]
MHSLGKWLENCYIASGGATLSNFDQLERAYPRPQLQRSHWICLNGQWKFTYDDEGKITRPLDIPEWNQTIEVPFAPESAKSGIGDTGFHPNCWYEREFNIVKGEGRVLLHFGAVDYRARVWINGQFMADHEGGHTPFSIDITPVFNEDGPQRITLWAQDDPQDLAKPRGKQDWQLEPHSIWYPRTTGIWQTVWAEIVPATYIERIRWTPHFERWEIGFEAFVAGEKCDGFEVKVRLTVGCQLLVNDTYEVIHGEIHRRIALSDPGIDDYRNELLWSPEKPTLIDAEVQLWSNGELIDEIKSYTAMRTVGIQRDRFMLNGRPYYLRLVLDQGYWPETLMTAPSDEALRRDVELVKEMGFNGVRKHQKIEDPRFLYWADVLGLMVWEEMPSAYRFSPKAVERITKEWTEVIERDASHPCIVVWVPFNESWGVPDLTATAAHQHCVQALYHLTKTLDPTRPVIGNDGWESAATDILAIHDYDNKPTRLAKRYGPAVKLSDLFDRQRPGGRVLTLDGYPHQGQPIMLTEFGGIAFAGREDKKAWGYVRSHDISELQIRYTALLDVVNRVELFSGFCYTQLTDTYQEANGLLYADRTPKFPIEAIAYATLGRGEEDEEDVMLTTVKAALGQENNVFPGAVEAGWSQADSIQQIPHCGGNYSH